MTQGWVSPVDFWRMHPDEFWWLVDAKSIPMDQENDKWETLYRMLD